MILRDELCDENIEGIKHFHISDFLRNGTY